MGVTAHWIDAESLERKSVALACRRVTGRHTYEVVADALEDVHSKFNLRGKVTLTVTDSGSNFIKAFRLFGTDANEAIQNEGSNESESGSDDEFDKDDDDDDSESASDDDVTFEDVSKVLDAIDQDEPLQRHLPQHQRCASHTLNLVASKDAEDATKLQAFRALSGEAFGKCKLLWNRASRSTVASDVIREKLGCALVVPNETRWNSTFDAMDKLRGIIEVKSENAFVLN